MASWCIAPASVQRCIWIYYEPFNHFNLCFILSVTVVSTTAVSPTLVTQTEEKYISIISMWLIMGVSLVVGIILLILLIVIVLVVYRRSKHNGKLKNTMSLC